ncbi:hypothetical protein R8N28_22980 [Vibrio sp. Vb1554]|uniref:hypothetical protein n=1 Tax=Vibrio sp. Vb1554 TaxID=3074642 RepID=UPI0021CE52B6|nr:hypothetical protein [Vibrio sp. Vb1554]MDW3048599.1 hypothetical protein [Vibrio sp. Vb1554]
MFKVISAAVLALIGGMASAQSSLEDLILIKPNTFTGQMNRVSCQSHILAFALVYEGYSNKRLMAFRNDPSVLSKAFNHEVSRLEAKIRREIKAIKRGSNSTRAEWEHAVSKVTNKKYRLRGTHTKLDGFRYDMSPKRFNAFIFSHFSRGACTSANIESCIINFSPLGRPPMLITSITFIEHQKAQQFYPAHVIGIVGVKKNLSPLSHRPEILTINTFAKFGKLMCPQWDGVIGWVQEYSLKSMSNLGLYYPVNWVERVP